MVNGISIKFKSYEETIPQLLKILSLDQELKKHSSIVIKPSLKGINYEHTSPLIVEEVLKYILNNKNPEAEVFIAEGSDETDTEEMFDSRGYSSLSEKYPVGLIDLNKAEFEEVENSSFLKFETIMFPKILLNSFVISIPSLYEDKETDINGSLSSMLGAYPSKHYKGFFSKSKNKIREWPIRFSVHDILVCKMPELAIIDASNQGVILAGRPLEMDKQAAKLIGKNWKEITHLKLANERFGDLDKLR